MEEERRLCYVGVQGLCRLLPDRCTDQDALREDQTLRLNPEIHAEMDTDLWG